MRYKNSRYKSQREVSEKAREIAEELSQEKRIIGIEVGDSMGGQYSFIQLSFCEDSKSTNIRFRIGIYLEDEYNYLPGSDLSFVWSPKTSDALGGIAKVIIAMARNKMLLESAYYPIEIDGDGDMK